MKLLVHLRLETKREGQGKQNDILWRSMSWGLSCHVLHNNGIYNERRRGIGGMACTVMDDGRGDGRGGLIVEAAVGGCINKIEQTTIP